MGSYVTPDDVRSGLRHVTQFSWNITYMDEGFVGPEAAECDFEVQTEDEAVIYHLVVPVEQRGRGIGGAMMEVALETIRAESDVSVIYSSVGDSVGTERLLQKYGFETEGRSDDSNVVIDGTLEETDSGSS